MLSVHSTEIRNVMESRNSKLTSEVLPIKNNINREDAVAGFTWITSYENVKRLTRLTGLSTDVYCVVCRLVLFSSSALDLCAGILTSISSADIKDSDSKLEVGILIKTGCDRTAKHLY